MILLFLASKRMWFCIWNKYFPRVEITHIQIQIICEIDFKENWQAIVWRLTDAWRPSMKKGFLRLDLGILCLDHHHHHSQIDRWMDWFLMPPADKVTRPRTASFAIHSTMLRDFLSIYLAAAARRQSEKQLFDFPFSASQTLEMDIACRPLLIPIDSLAHKAHWKANHRSRPSISSFSCNSLFCLELPPCEWVFLQNSFKTFVRIRSDYDHVIHELSFVDFLRPKNRCKLSTSYAMGKH